MNGTSGLEIQSVSSDSVPEWKTFVESHSAATVFHTTEWARAIEAAFGYEPRYVLVTDRSGEIHAAVPGFAVAEGIGHSVLNPFCEYGFPLIDEGTSEVAVLSALRDGDTHIVKDTGWSGVSGYNAAGYGGIPTGTVHRLDTDRPFEAVWESAFEKRARQYTRTAEDHAVEVFEGDIGTYYPLYRETMERLGSPQFPFVFFEALETHLNDTVTVLVAAIEGRPIGAMFLFEWDDVSIMWGIGSRTADWEHRPNHLLYTQAIERACRSDTSVVDFGRSRHGSGVHEFKSQFGGFEYPLTSFVTPPHHTGRASLDGYGRLAAITPRLAPLITHPAVGPKLKKLIHE